MEKEVIITKITNFHKILKPLVNLHLSANYKTLET